MAELVEGGVPALTPGAAPTLAAPLLVGRRVMLRPYMSGIDDQLLVYIMNNAGDVVSGVTSAFTRTPSDHVHIFVSAHQVLFTVVNAKDPNDLIGFVGGYAYTPRARWMSIDAFCRPELRNTGVVLDAFLLMMEYAFFQFGLRTVRCEMSEWNYSQVATGQRVGRLLEPEGRLQDFFFLQGRYWDQVHLRCDRERWAAMRERFLRYVVPKDRHHLIFELPRTDP